MHGYMNLDIKLFLIWDGGDYRTYNIVFNGIEKHGTVAIGSHGLIKNPENRQIFMDGFKEMIKRIEPKEIILYGPYTNEMKNLCENNGIKVAHFESEQTASRKELNKWVVVIAVQKEEKKHMVVKTILEWISKNKTSIYQIQKNLMTLKVL